MHPNPSSADIGAITINNQSRTEARAPELHQSREKLLLRSGLEQRFANATRPEAECPQKVKRDDKAAERVGLIPEPPSPPPIATTYWKRLDQK